MAVAAAVSDGWLDSEIELSLPLPKGTVKKDVVVVLTAESIKVRHTKLGKTLLHINPLSGVAVPEVVILLAGSGCF